MIEYTARAIPSRKVLVSQSSARCPGRVPQRSDDPCWEMILELNTLRNDLAHKLESTKRQGTLSKLFKIHGQVQPTPGIVINKSEENSLNEAKRLRLVVQDSMKFLLSLIF